MHKQILGLIGQAFLTGIVAGMLIHTAHCTVAGPNMQGHPQQTVQHYSAPVVATGERPPSDFPNQQTRAEQERPLGDVAREYRKQKVAR